MAKRQSTLYDNDVRHRQLDYIEPERLTIKVGHSQEFLTKSGKVITVEHRVGHIQGVKGQQKYYMVTDGGQVKGPFKSIGIKNYIKRN